jgi:hypothetical protein
MTGEAIVGIITASGAVLTGVFEAYRRIAQGNTKRITDAIGAQTTSIAQQNTAINQQSACITKFAEKNGRDQVAIQDAVGRLNEVALTMLRTSERCQTVESMRRDHPGG